MKKENTIKYVAVLVGALLLLFLMYTLLFGGNGAVNPAETTDENPAAGLTYAVLFNQGKLYDNIDSDDQNLRLIQNDLALFARTTIPSLSKPDSLVGFTFDDAFTEDNKTFTHTGYYYGFEDTIRVAVTVHETGILTLSITNTRDETNIDESLNLNGPKNRLAVKLPIDTDYYSLRYSKNDDKIVAAFYRGYSESHVNEVVNILNEAYGGSYDENDVVFNVNSVGIFSLNGVRNYSKSPENAL